MADNKLPTPEPFPPTVAPPNHIDVPVPTPPTPTPVYTPTPPTPVPPTPTPALYNDSVGGYSYGAIQEPEEPPHKRYTDQTRKLTFRTKDGNVEIKISDSELINARHIEISAIGSDNQRHRIEAAVDDGKTNPLVRGTDVPLEEGHFFANNPDLADAVRKAANAGIKGNYGPAKALIENLESQSAPMADTTTGTSKGGRE